MTESYFQSPEFKRMTGNATDSGVKFIFKWIGIGIKSFAEFIKMMVYSLLGK